MKVARFHVYFDNQEKVSGIVCSVHVPGLGEVIVPDCVSQATIEKLAEEIRVIAKARLKDRLEKLQTEAAAALPARIETPAPENPGEECQSCE